MPIAHNEGNYFANVELLRNLEDNNLITFKYCNKNGNIEKNSNPNGSSNNIAGILNDKKNITEIIEIKGCAKDTPFYEKIY